MEKDRWIVFQRIVDIDILVPEKMFKSEKEAFSYVFDKEKGLEEVPQESEIDPTRSRIAYEIHDYLGEFSSVWQYDDMDVHLMDESDFDHGSLAYTSNIYYKD